MTDDVIALLEFERGDKGIHIVSEKHYRLVPHEEVGAADLSVYSQRPTQ